MIENFNGQMFYISDIHGVLTPYDPERFRIERQTQLAAELREAERLAEYTGSPEDVKEAESTQSSQRGAESRRAGTSVSGEQRTDPIATGLAGATMLHGEGSTGKQGASKISSDQRQQFRTDQLLKHMLRPAARLSKKVQEDPQKDTHKNPYAKLDEPQPTRHKAICVKEIMSKEVTTLVGDQTIEEAGVLFRDHRFRHIPILSAPEGRLIGIFSDRDYLSAVDKHQPVSSHMATAVLTARPETEIRRVAEVMFEHRIGAMPVLDDHESLVGIVTRSDILCALVHGAPLELWV